MIDAKLASGVILAGALLGAGCAGQNRAPAPTLHADNVTRASALQAGHEVLSRLYFPIEKLDVEQGVIRTRPLRGAQFFELWRADNASCFAAAEANLQTVRRTVELRVTTQADGPQAQDANVPTLAIPASGLYLACAVSVQRLSLPTNESRITSQTLRLHSRSTATGQRVAVPARQERVMAWMDLGQDPDLARKILQRVRQELARTKR